MALSARQSTYVSLPVGVVLPYYADVSNAYAIRSTTQGPMTSWTNTVSGEQFEIPMFISFTYSTDATVTNRTIIVSFRSGGTNLAQAIAPANQTATQSIIYSFANGSSATASVINTSTVPDALGFAVSGIPPIVLYPGQTIVAFAQNVQAGDLMGTVNYDRIIVPTMGEGFDPAASFDSIPVDQLQQ